MGPKNREVTLDWPWFLRNLRANVYLVIALQSFVPCYKNKVYFSTILSVMLN